MDDQAIRLRELAHQVRHASIVSTGPPLVLVVGDYKSAGVRSAVDLLVHAAIRQGVRVDTSCLAESRDLNPCDDCDWQLASAATEQPSDSERFRRASALVVVTACDDDSILSTYKILKAAVQHGPLPPAVFLFAEAEDGTTTHGVYTRLASTCEQFLKCRAAGYAIAGAPACETQHGLGALVNRLLQVAPVASPAGGSRLALQAG